MIRRKRSMLCLLLVAAAFGVCVPSAWATPGDPFARAPARLDQLPKATSRPDPGDWGVGDQNGAERYTFPVAIAPGRNGVAPGLGVSDGTALASTAAASVVARSNETLHRVALSHAAWDPATDTYSHDYLYPHSWPLRLDGCDSLVDGQRIGDARPAGSGLFWQLRPLDGQHVEPFSVPGVDLSHQSSWTCNPVASLPALGRWEITLTVSAPSGELASFTHVRTFRDVLIAAVGDSFTSGEGNMLGNWTDEQCHRSYGAWGEHLAERLENGTGGVGVTFVNLACSGATIANLASSNYGGIIKDAAGGPHQLLPQLRALGAMLGDPLAPETRSVDVLLATAGLNDMGTGVGDLLKGCAILHDTCQQDLSDDIAGLRDSYDQLELAISANLRLGHAYFAGYPARIFTNAADQFSGCGVFDMSAGDAKWIYRTVEAINRQTTMAAARWGWTFMPTTELFRNHGYCADVAWFRPYLATKRFQGDDKGTAHPNQSGHEETARAASRIVRTDVPAPAPDVFDVRFLRVRVTDKLHVPWPGELSVSVARRQRGACGHTTETVTGLKLNSWNDLSANPCMRFHVRTAGRTVMIAADTYLNPVPHRDNPPQDEQHGKGHRTPVRPGPVLLEVHRFLRRANGWNATPPPGPGYVVQHFVDAHDNGRIEIEYEITRPQVAKVVR